MYVIFVLLCLYSLSVIIVIVYRYGYKIYDLGVDEVRNSWIVSLIILGEGWYNNYYYNLRVWFN